MKGQGDGLTRRKFLHLVGLAGGSAAVYETMVTLGLLRTPEAWAGPPKLPEGIGTGKSVVVLGAGVAGLAAAYELQKAKYTVTVLEATARTGGRSLTVRRDNVIQQMGMPDQTCRFDEGRTSTPDRAHPLPSPGGALLLPRPQRRARGLRHGEPGNRFQTRQGVRGASRSRTARWRNDTRGYVAELLAKAVRDKSLDKELSADDKQKLLSLLLTFGDLNRRSYRYDGSPRSGFRVEPGVDEPGTIDDPALALKSLLKSEFWKHRFYQPEDYEWQTTLFEPVGGMDKFADALAKPGRERQQGDQERRGGRGHQRRQRRPRRLPRPRLGSAGRAARRTTVSATFRCRSCARSSPTAPSRTTTSRPSPPSTTPTPARWPGRRERFWESSENQIYGGISWIDHPITQMWYPSGGFFTPKGVLTGTYNYSDVAKEFGEKSLEKRLETALEGAGAAPSGLREARGREARAVDRLAARALPAGGLGQLDL